MPMLFIESPEGPADVLEVVSPLTTIGRAPDNRVTLDDPQVSRHHAAIEFERPFFIIRNISRGGRLHVNGKAVHFKALVSGDALSIGRYRLRFVSDRDYVEGVKDVIEARSGRRVQLRGRAKPQAQKAIRH